MFFFFDLKTHIRAQRKKALSKGNRVFLLTKTHPGPVKQPETKGNKRTLVQNTNPGPAKNNNSQRETKGHEFEELWCKLKSSGGNHGRSLLEPQGVGFPSVCLREASDSIPQPLGGHLEELNLHSPSQRCGQQIDPIRRSSPLPPKPLP